MLVQERHSTCGTRRGRCGPCWTTKASGTEATGRKAEIHVQSPEWQVYRASEPKGSSWRTCWCPLGCRPRRMRTKDGRSCSSGWVCVRLARVGHAGKFQWAQLTGESDKCTCRISCDAQVNPYISNYSAPEGSMTGSVTRYRWKGPLSGMFVGKAIQTGWCVRIYKDSDG